MKRPSFQFYPGDWLSNKKLRRCSHAERGIWLEVLCLMHDSERYGVLDWPLDDIAQAVGCKAPELRSLIRKQVIKGADRELTDPYVFTPRHAGKDGEPVTLIHPCAGPIWYSTRMVRDEYVRSKAGGPTRFKSPNPTPSPSPSHRHGEPPSQPQGAEPSQGQGAGASSSSSSSVLQSQVLPSADADPWLLGKEFLIARGVSASTVGGFIGKLVSDHGKDNVVNALQAAIVNEPADVKGYIVGALRSKKAKNDIAANNLAVARGIQ